MSFSIVPSSENGSSRSGSSLGVLSRIDKKQSEISDLMKNNGCCHCEFDRNGSSNATQSFKLLLSFNSLEGLNRFVAATGASDLRFHKVYLRKVAKREEEMSRGVSSPHLPAPGPIPGPVCILSDEHKLLPNLNAIIFSDTWTDFGKVFCITIDPKELENLNEAVKYFTFGEYNNN